MSYSRSIRISFRKLQPTSSINSITYQRQISRPFTLSAVNMVKVGDSIPDIELYEDSPGNRVNLAKELATGKGLIIGTPAAFSPACSDSHIPGYIAEPKTKEAGKVFVVSVNDAFVMKAWQKSLDADKSSGIRFIGDSAGKFTQAWDVEFDASELMGNKRSKRYAVSTENGKVTKVAVEPDNIGVNESAAEKFLA